MAQRVVVTLSDDIDGGEAAETVAFAWTGSRTRSTSIPPMQRNCARPWPRTWRRAESRQTPKRDKSRISYRHTSLEPAPAAVRAWAQSNKMDVPARGRIPKAVYEAFREAS